LFKRIIFAAGVLNVKLEMTCEYKRTARWTVDVCSVMKLKLLEGIVLYHAFAFGAKVLSTAAPNTRNDGFTVAHRYDAVSDTPTKRTRFDLRRKIGRIDNVF
jgi:hypothetical protein